MLIQFLCSVFSNFLFFILHVNPANAFPKSLSSKKEKEYLERMKDGDEIARKKLIEHNLRLVAHVTKKYYSPNTNIQDDLISIGTIGLIKAINTFDMSKGIRLSSYAARCIENEILMYFRSSKKSALDISIEEPIETDKDGNALTLMDTMASQSSIVDDIDIKIKSEKLQKYITKSLTERERMIIEMRYGLNNKKPLTQREVAKALNISRSYVSRIEKKALQTLRKNFKD